MTIPHAAGTSGTGAECVIPGMDATTTGQPNMPPAGDGTTTGQPDMPPAGDGTTTGQPDMPLAGDGTTTGQPAMPGGDITTDGAAQLASKPMHRIVQYMVVASTQQYAIDTEPNLEGYEVLWYCV